MRHRRQTRQHGEHQLIAAVLRSDNMNDKDSNDRLCNDALEAIVITICLVAIAGGALAMYDLVQRAAV